jgi:GntR family transcriptional regulator, rspAB operon transcriptional repressor
VIYHECITNESLSAQAYAEIRRKIIRLELAPGEVVREELLQESLGIGRTPIREALQRLARDQFVTVIPRRGMFVSSIDVSELSMLYETRAVMEPYAARLASLRGTQRHWSEMRGVIAAAGVGPVDDQALLDIDHRCHEIIWAAAGNRFLTDSLDVLYAQSDRVWHMYLADVADTRHAVDEHEVILDALESGDSKKSAKLVEAHVRSFDHQVRTAVTNRLAPPLAGA